MIVSKVNGWLSKLVGPNAAHMIDAAIGVAIPYAVTFAVSPGARVFLLHHSLLAVIVGASILPATALASKFRKAAGSSAPLADEIAAVVAAKILVAEKQT